jgi:peptidoglycan hydrolase-like protein with peptidoglycan-binding domain
MRLPSLLGVVCGLLCIFLPHLAQAQAAGEQREYVVTAYYSPIPGQCCYVKGSLEADRILNGQGTHGADGTAVYPGMVAAPPSYAFGTQIELAGIGTVSVRDRGGAIQVLDGDVHRIDLWVGEGEEGLARAMAFGVRRVRGTVLGQLPTEPARIDLDALVASYEVIAPYDVTNGSLLGLQVEAGKHGLSVARLQKLLQETGHLTAEASGFFGEQTQQALMAFQSSVGLAVDATRLTDEAAAVLEEVSRRRALTLPFGQLEPGSTHPAVTDAKRILRSLGWYEGRTGATYDDALKGAVLAFQQARGLAGDAQSPGAGRIGPKTLSLLQADWQMHLAKVAAKRRLDVLRVRQQLEAQGVLLSGGLQPGVKGTAVRTLQSLLVRLGLLAGDAQTGTFGEKTEAALASFQVQAGLIDAPTHPAAGMVGPETLKTLRRMQLRDTLQQVRAQGWVGAGLSAPL